MDAVSYFGLLKDMADIELVLNFDLHIFIRHFVLNSQQISETLALE